MFVKYDENGVITSLFINCTPEDVEEYVEIPDDEEIAREFREKHRTPPGESTPDSKVIELEERVAALSAALLNL